MTQRSPRKWLIRKRPPNAATRTLTEHLARVRIRQIVILMGAVASLAALVTLDRMGMLLYPGDEMQQFDGRSFKVARVIDGDTLHITIPPAASFAALMSPRQPGRLVTVPVRLWGIDCPEIEKKHEGTVVRQAQPWAHEARHFTSDLCQDKQVTLRLQRHEKRDKFGRLLAYVQLADGSSLNQKLLGAGLAHTDDRFSHDRWSEFQAVEREAKQAKRGIWSREAPPDEDRSLVP